MCSIAGVFSRKNAEVFPVLVRLLSLMKHRGSDGFGIATNKGSAYAGSLKGLSKKPVAGTHGIAHGLLSVTGHGAQPFSSCDKGFFLCHNGQIYNYLELNNSLKRHSFQSNSDSETIVHFLEEHDFDYKKFMQKASGSYAVALSFKDSIVAFRDFVGVRQLWYGFNEGFFAFASEPMALKAIGIAFPLPLEPGFLLEFSKKGLVKKKVFSFEDFAKTIPKKHSFERLFSSFNESISFRCRNLSRAGILFSGGIDSSVIAKAVSMHVKNTNLFACGVEGSHDIKTAEMAAKELGLKLFVNEVKRDEVPLMALQACRSLGFFDKMQLSIALPLFGACEEAKKRGERVVFSGQGSDELFCGYSYYASELERNGFSGVQKRIFRSVSSMWATDLFRDDAVSMANSLELRLPFLDNEFLQQALAFSAKEKIFSPTDALRKHPVRKIGKTLGLPEEIVQRKKKAAQYGSGFAKELELVF